MHNGQIGDFEQVRRRLEAGLPDRLYDQLHGSTDSELIFLMMLAEGLDRDPHGALWRTVSRIVATIRSVGVEPHLKLTCAFADGERLHAVRYAIGGSAPTLYAGSFRGLGRCLVSEPFDHDDPNWQAVPPGSFVTMTRDSMVVRPFEPAVNATAIAV